MQSYYDIPNAIFYELKGDYKQSPAYEGFRARGMKPPPAGFDYSAVSSQP